jgi:putative nucleotidyltransferase with HDIG domain
MFLVRFDGAWLDHAAWRQKYRIASAEQLAGALGSGAQWCWIDPSLGLAADPTADPAAVAAPAPAQASERLDVAASPAPAGGKRAPLADEMRRAKQLRQQARSTVAAVFADARLGQVPDIGATRPIVAGIVDSVLRRKAAMLCLGHLKLKDDYTFMHSISVCALAAAMAHELGLDLAACRSAGLAALLHDVGKSRVPLELLNKPGALADAEWALVRDHPKLGHDLLQEARIAEAEVLDVCLHHHERVDGTGYPHRLLGEAISPLARIVAVCDVFDAMTSERPYKPAWDPAQALKEMAKGSGHLDRGMLAVFVRVVGIYPVGSMVRLASGRLAVVVDNPGTDPRTPAVRVFYSTRAHEPLAPQLLDLGAGKGSDRIVALEPRERWAFPHLEALCALPT